jgi:two-component system, cell cycle sensor histidine kinase and response regulator CckA
MAMPEPLSAEPQARRDQLSSWFGEIPTLIAILRGPEHIYEFANRAFLTAARLENVVGTPFGLQKERVADEDIVARLDRVYAAGEPERIPEARLLHAAADGTTTDEYYDTTVQPIRGASGAVEGVLLHAIVVTAQVLARRRIDVQREELREAEALLGTVITNAPIILWSVDTRGVFTLSVGRELGTLGLAQGQVVGSSVFDMVDVPHIHRALAGEELTATVDMGEHTFETMYRPLRDPAGAVTGVLGVSTNITERRRAEREQAKLQAQLLQIQKLESLGVLAGGIAHDFNNLLTSMLGCASVAQNLLPESSPALPAVNDVISAARRAADLTHQLLAYSGKGRFEVRAIDLSEDVREISHLLQATLPKNVLLQLELDAHLPAVEGDVAQIQQLVLNLVVNGAEAIGDQPGNVLVTTGVEEVDASSATNLVGSAPLAPGRYVFVEVRDTGCGMDDATKAKIFDPFFTTKFTGRGLGLAATLGIVRGHKGAVGLSSTPGKGTSFRVLLPASSLAVQRRGRPLATDFAGTGTVLVVDDDKGVRGTLRMLLTTMGFDVLEARDGREAIEMFAANVEAIVLVVLDLTMPVLSGGEVFAELCQIRSDVRVILSSGYDKEETTRRFPTKGLAGFLQKPYSSADLAEKLRAALDSKA